MGKYYDELIKKNTGDKKAWLKAKSDYFDKHIAPQLDSRGASIPEAQAEWDSLSSDANRDSAKVKTVKIQKEKVAPDRTGLPTAHKKAHPPNDDGLLSDIWSGAKGVARTVTVPIRNNVNIEKKDVYDFARKTSDVAGGFVFNPDLMAKLKGTAKPKAEQSQEEKDYRATQRGVGNSIIDSALNSTVGKVITDPDFLSVVSVSVPPIQPLALYIQTKKRSYKDRKQAGKLTKEEQLKEKYPFQPQGLAEKIPGALVGGGIDAVPMFGLSKAKFGMKTIMGGMGLLSSFMDTKKKADKGDKLTFADFQNIVRRGVQGVAMGAVASKVGNVTDKLSNKVMGNVVARQEDYLASSTYNKVLRPTTIKRMDNVVRTGVNTVGDVASFGVTRTALTGKMPTADDFIADMVSSLAIYKGMGKASQRSNNTEYKQGIKEAVIKFGLRSQNKKQNKDVFKKIDKVFDNIIAKQKSGVYDNDTAKQALEVNMGALYGQLKGEKSYGDLRDDVQKESIKEKKTILKKREYEAIYGETPAIRKSAMETLEIILPRRAKEIQSIIDQDVISKKRYKDAVYEDPKMIYDKLGDEYVPDLPDGFPKRIGKPKFNNEVSEKTEIAIENITESLSKNIDDKLNSGMPLNKIELMEGFDSSILKDLNKVQKKSAQARTLEILKDKYGLGSNKEYERQYLRDLRDKLLQPEKVFKRVDNVPDAFPEKDLLTKEQFDRMRLEVMKQKSFLPKDRKTLIDELRRRVRKDNPDMQKGEEIESRVAIESVMKATKDRKWRGATEHLFEPMNKDDSVALFRKKTFTKKILEEVENLVGKETMEKVLEKEIVFSTPIFKSNVDVLKHEMGKTGKNFNPKGSKNPIKRLKGELNYMTQQSSRVFENLVSKEYRKLIYDPVIEAGANAHVEVIKNTEEFAKQIKGLTKKQRKKIATHLYSKQEESLLALKEMGVNTVKDYELSPKEKNVVKYIEGEMKNYIERVNLSRTASGLEKIDPKGDYFTIVRRLDKFIREGGDPSLSDQKIWNNDLVKKDAPELFSSKLRKKSAEHIEISLDLKKIMDGYIKNTVNHIHVSPVTSKVRALINFDKDGFSFANQNPGLHKYTSKWLDRVVGVRSDLLDSPMLDKIVRGVMTNVSSASLAYNITTVLSQPEALFNTIVRFRKDMPGALHDMATKGKFAEEHSPELYTRVMDVTIRDTESAFSRGVQKVVDAGMYPMKKTDAMSAKLHWYASVRNQKRLRSEGKNKFSDKEIYRIASQDMVNSHSSGSRAHIAPIQGSTGGKLFTQFMTYQLNQYHSLKRDVLGIGNEDVSKLKGLQQGVEFAILAGLSNTVREAFGMPGMYSSPITAIAQGLYSPDGSVEWQQFNKKRHKPESGFGTFINVLNELGKTLPLASSGYGAVSSLLQRAYREGVDKKDGRKFAEQAIKLLGVPGSSTAIKIIRLFERISEDSTEQYNRESANKKRGETLRRTLDDKLTPKEERAKYTRELNKGRRHTRRKLY